MGIIVSVNLSDKKGVVKKPVAEIRLMPGQGVLGDAHAGPGDRQVSLLMIEDIEKAGAAAECGVSEGGDGLGPGSFAENLTTRGLDLGSLRLGDQLEIASGIRLRVTRIGKECHRPCAIFYKTGNCIMPERGIFCEALDPGVVRPGVRIVKN